MAEWINLADGKPLDENVTVTAEQAGSALAAREGEVSSYIEGIELAELAGITDLSSRGAQGQSRTR